MALDYSTIRYLEKVGSNVHIHYVDGTTVPAFTDGRGRYLPRKATGGDAPETYEPWVPPGEPTDPPPPGSWAHPLAGAVLTSGFGMRAGGFHYGVDLSTTTAATGGPVRSVTDMVITVAVDAFEGGNSTGGTYVKGHTPEGAYTFCYYHGADESLAVSVGQTVTAGTQLFVEGATGNVTGTHLHFEIIMGNHPNPWPPPYANGAQFVDPLPILRAHGVNI
jgi:murein DD-endopeptidase MepM/ murein hydrolase activator NlpD